MKILTNFDFSMNQILNVVLQNLATQPTQPAAGQVYFDTNKNRYFGYTGAKWIGMDALDAVMSGQDIIEAINNSSSVIADSSLSTAARAAISKAHDEHNIATVDGLQAALDGKASAASVKTNVPVGAKFTDTITTINDKTGAISKADIVALGIPAQDTVVDISGKADKTYVDNKVKTNVPTGALFTDTNTITSINGKTGAISKADIVALGIPSQDTQYSLPVASATLGGVKNGTDITVDAVGNVTVKPNTHKHTIANVTNLQGLLDSKETPTGAQNKADTAEGNAAVYTDNSIASLVGSAPEVLDTLHEIAEALGNDPNFATTMTTELSKKTDKYVGKIGDATRTSYVITHNLASRDVVVLLRETAAPYAQVVTDVEMTTVNTVTVKFARAPATNEFTITIIG